MWSAEVHKALWSIMKRNNKFLKDKKWKRSQGFCFRLLLEADEGSFRSVPFAAFAVAALQFHSHLLVRVLRLLCLELLSLFFGFLVRLLVELCRDSACCSCCSAATSASSFS